MRHDRNLTATANMWKKHFRIGQEETNNSELENLQLFQDDSCYDTGNVQSKEDSEVLRILEDISFGTRNSTGPRFEFQYSRKAVNDMTLQFYEYMKVNCANLRQVTQTLVDYRFIILSVESVVLYKE